jgi:hypothetical protein
MILDSYFVLLAYAKQLWLKEVARYDKFCVGGDDEVFSREKKNIQKLTCYFLLHRLLSFKIIIAGFMMKRLA